MLRPRNLFSLGAVATALTALSGCGDIGVQIKGVTSQPLIGTEAPSSPQPPITPPPVMPPPAICLNDSQCFNDEVCRDQICVHECDIDSQCSAAVCRAHRCTNECASDASCAEGSFCSLLSVGFPSCTECASGTIAITNTGGCACPYSWQRFSAEANACVARTCVSDSECGSGNICSNGSCQQGPRQSYVCGGEIPPEGEGLPPNLDPAEADLCSGADVLALYETGAHLAVNGRDPICHNTPTHFAFCRLPYPLSSPYSGYGCCPGE